MAVPVGRAVTGKVVAIVLPISAFVAGGFEHSVASVYLLPVGLAVMHEASDGFWAGVDTSRDTYGDVDWSSAVLDNLVPVTIGNIVGGAVLVGLVYAFVYRTPKAAS